MIEDYFQIDESKRGVFLEVLNNIERDEPTPQEVDPRIRPLLEGFLKALYEHPRI